MARAAVREHGQDAEAGIYPDGAAFIDGEVVPIAEARIPILDWGFLRSDCTYDVVHVWNGRFFRLDHHLDRFEKSAAGLRLSNPYEREQVVAILMRLVRATGLREAYVEVILTRGMPPKGSRDPRQCENRFYAFVIPFVWIATEEMRARGIHLHVSEVLRIPPQSVDPAIKNFHWGDLMRGVFESYEQGCDLPVLVDQDGNIAEGPGFNLFAVKEGRVTTPEGTCLLGISRQTALDLLAEQNVERVIGPISPGDLETAEEVFITSTAGGILPVTRIDHRPVGDGHPGPVSTRLRNLYWQRHDEGWQGTPIDYD
ncbi:MAG: aminotransferase class family protein [Geminicoccaceae bacterium]|nr:aminotransferase class family protein [Geminicoccaceae bacterium]